MSHYYDEICAFAKEIKESVEKLFAFYGNELLLRIEEYNLLSHPDNAVESSTAIGYLIEEFVVAKLEMYTATPSSNCKSPIVRPESAIASEASYDCFSMRENIKCLVNVKVNKQGSANNAVAAINKLLEDYIEDSNQEKCYMVLKIHYDFGRSKHDREGARKILINKVETFFLEEVDFSHGHQQDHRNWSKEFNPNSGRLQISAAFRRKHKVDPNNISYQNTFSMLKNEFEKRLKS